MILPLSVPTLSRLLPLSLIAIGMLLMTNDAMARSGTKSSSSNSSSSVIASSSVDTPVVLPAGKFVIDLEEIHCASCAKKLSRKLYAVKGVSKVETDVKKNQATVYLPKEQTIEPKTLWLAAIEGKTKPTELRYLDQTVTAEQMKQILAAE